MKIEPTYATETPAQFEGWGGNGCWPEDIGDGETQCVEGWGGL